MSTVSATAPVSASSPSVPSSAWNEIRKLAPYLGRCKGEMTAGLLTLMAVGIVGALPQLLMGAITDCLRGLPQPLSTLTGTSRSILQPVLQLYTPYSRHTLTLYCSMLVGAMLIKDYLSFWMRRILLGMSRRIEHDLRNDLHAQFVKLEGEFYTRNRTGDLMSRSTNDLNAVRMLLGQGIMFAATTLATGLVTVYFMLQLSPGLTLWVLLTLPAVAIADRYFGKTIHRLSGQIQSALGVLSSRAEENITGLRVVRAYVQEKYEAAQFDAINREYASKNIQLIGVMSIFFPAVTALMGLTFIVLLWVGGLQTIEQRISVGTLWAFYAFLVRLAWPMMALGWVTNIFERAGAAAGRLNYILSLEPGISDRAVELNLISAPTEDGRNTFLPASDIFGEIEFRNLTFAYPISHNGSSCQPVLHNIDLLIPAGSTLAIVGPTGSGKSTLAALIVRLWEAPDKTVLLDGSSIRKYPLDQLRRAIGYVPQDTFLFNDTIRENIAFGVNDASEEEISNAADIVGLAAEIQGFPEHFETIVGERGKSLSGGQKQRIALARALLHQPKILLLDDALSNIDTDTEDRILQRLRVMMQQRTTILISHRVSTVKVADQIIVLHEGKIVERGNHQQLLELGGYYADLHLKQMLEEELERQ